MPNMYRLGAQGKRRLQYEEGILPQLSPHYAFVVQFRTDVHLETGHMAGRVEHVVSGQATHFASLETLLAFMVRVLENLGETPPSQEP
jgi:hypothetical protein